MFIFSRFGKFVIGAVLLIVSAVAFVAYANHSWGSYHWARTMNPFILKLGDNVAFTWDAYLASASTDWNNPLASTTVLSTTVVSGQGGNRCRPTLGRVEVCNRKYGNNGWLGVASIWVSGNHITQGTVKLNDTYFNTSTYNTPAWRQFVMCQEIGHTFGLDHQDENFNNVNLGTCMDYTNDPDGTLHHQLSNEHPNMHDYDQLETIYAHLDTITTALSKKTSFHAASDIDTSNPSQWGKAIRKSANGRTVLHERDLGKGQKLFTFVIWADEDGTK